MVKNMNKRLDQKINVKNPTIIRWYTEAADFLQIEISPTHIVRIKIDKPVTK